MVGMVSTFGGTLGPFLGGKLGASGDYYVGARYATAGSLLAVALVFFLPATYVLYTHLIHIF